MQIRSTEGKLASVTTRASRPTSEANASLMAQLRDRPGGLIQSQRPFPISQRPKRPELPERIGELVVQQFPQREGYVTSQLQENGQKILMARGRRVLQMAQEDIQMVMSKNRINFSPGFYKGLQRLVEQQQDVLGHEPARVEDVIQVLYSMQRIVPLTDPTLELAESLVRDAKNLTGEDPLVRKLTDGLIEQFVFLRDYTNRRHLLRIIRPQDVTPNAIAALMEDRDFQRALIPFKQYRFGEHVHMPQISSLSYPRLDTVEIKSLIIESEGENQKVAWDASVVIFNWRTSAVLGPVDALIHGKLRRSRKTHIGTSARENAFHARIAAFNAKMAIDEEVQRVPTSPRVGIGQRPRQKTSDTQSAVEEVRHMKQLVADFLATQR